MSDSLDIDDISLMYEAARSFVAGAKIIMVSDGIQEDQAVKLPTLPVILCSAIAIEISLKAILKMNGSSRPKGDGHDLNQLFSALPVEKQLEILEYQSAYTEIPATEVRQTILEIKDVFKTWRYAYEHASIQIKPDFLFHLALAFVEYIEVNSNIERSSNGWKLLKIIK